MWKLINLQFVIYEYTTYCSVRFEVISKLIQNFENLVSELDFLLAGCTGNVVLPTRKVQKGTLSASKHNRMSEKSQKRCNERIHCNFALVLLSF